MEVHTQIHEHAHTCAHKLLMTEITDLRPSHNACLNHEKNTKSSIGSAACGSLNYQIGLSQEMSNWHSFVGPTCGPHAACVPRGL